uniref:Spermatosis associated 1 n=1 Tax=Gadus morhua TaxID=8049 RepID=A0A8C5AJL0_GADMO
KLNKVPAEAIESFISAGFIRVYPDITLKNLRSELGIFLGPEIRVDKFSFLKCVGRSLAVVKHEQERELKVKTFAPPYVGIRTLGWTVTCVRLWASAVPIQRLLNTKDVADMGCISLSQGDELIEEIKMVRGERKQLEWTRQELLRKGKDLLAQNRNRRNQARDSWKKKYFETKKATAPMEETLRNLRQELETFYNKLLHQLQARDGRGRNRHQGRSSTKNELIIQIMTESHEIDNLRRQVEDAKMKLITEIRLRKQAATELRALKAELAQKKSQSIHTGPITSQPFGPIPRNRPYAQKAGC